MSIRSFVARHLTVAVAGFLLGTVAARAGYAGQLHAAAARQPSVAVKVVTQNQTRSFNDGWLTGQQDLLEQGYTPSAHRAPTKIEMAKLDRALHAGLACYLGWQHAGYSVVCR